MPSLRRIYDHIVLTTGLAYYGIVGVLYNLAAVPFWLLLPAKQGTRLGRRMLTALFRSYLFLLTKTGRVKFDLSSLDQLKGKNCLLAANHPGLMDAVLIASRLNNIACVTKASLWNNPVLLGGIRLARYIPNHTPTQLVRDTTRSLAEGSQVLLFCEGTRTTQPPMNHFSGLTALISRKAGIPVTPVFLEYHQNQANEKPFLGKGWSFFSPPPFPVRISARVGPAVSAEPGEDTRAFTRRLQAIFHQNLGNHSRFDPNPSCNASGRA